MRVRLLKSFLLFSVLVKSSCARSELTGNRKEGYEIEQSVRVVNTELPKNWPWRGISFQSGKSTLSDVDYLASTGVNFLRIQLRSPVLVKEGKTDPTEAFYDELEWAAQVLDACKRNNLTSVIAFNYLVLDPRKDVTEKDPMFWNEQDYLDSTYKMVEIIAERFKGRGNELSAYEVMGEPVYRTKSGAISPPKLETFFINVLGRIKKHDNTRWFLLTPGPWGTPANYENFKPFNISNDKIIYGAHMYLPDAYTHQGVKERKLGYAYPGNINNVFWDKERIRRAFLPLAQFQEKNKCLVYIGEFQAVRYAKGADQWVEDVLEVMDEHNWSWSLFAFKARTSFWDPYFDVSNRAAPADNEALKEIGPTTPLWKFMVKEYEKNKTRK